MHYLCGLNKENENNKVDKVDKGQKLKFTIKEFTISLFTIYDLFTIEEFSYSIDD